MTCVACQNKIEKKLSRTAGVKHAKVSYGKGTADITYDADIVALKDICSIIENLGYRVLTGHEKQVSGKIRVIVLLIAIISLYIVLQHFGIINMLVPGRLAETNMSYGMLFVIGLITSVHCVAMCGGINVSQCIPRVAKTADSKIRLGTFRAALLYNSGRVVSYTTVGFIVGALGSTFNFSNTLQGVLKLFAGIFMVIMGINMLDMFPWLRKLNPGMPKVFADKINSEKHRRKSPLIVGLLNGLMPCGPLQAMQIYALSTGNPLKGALSMLLFSMGTVPLMFGLGALSSALSKKFARKIMTTGAVLVVVLGLSMFSQGWNLSGFTLPGQLIGGEGDVQSGNTDVNTENDVQIIKSTLSPGKYPNITVKDGIPVKWVINAPEGSINGCNYRMVIPEYGIEYSFSKGENVIEFTPSRVGEFRYTCWMGMISGTITVTQAETS